MNKPLFGTAGLPKSYHDLKKKNSLFIPEYLNGFGLNAFEYQAGRGVRLSQKMADSLKENGEKFGITYSIHAPYYISMSSMEEEKRLNSVNYILQSAKAVLMLGGNRVIFHSGSCGKQSREQALAKAQDTLNHILQALAEEDLLDKVYICPETMGKVGQLGTLDEVLTLCQQHKRIIPCIDFGHLNARTQGEIKGKKEFSFILDKIEQALPDERASNFHVHFSKIEYTKGGEKRHLTFEDTVFGPDYEPFIELIAQRKLTPTIICESDGTQAEDAQTMQKLYNKEIQKNNLNI